MTIVNPIKVPGGHLIFGVHGSIKLQFWMLWKELPEVRSMGGSSSGCSARRSSRVFNCVVGSIESDI